jgi:hypothetical protein
MVGRERLATAATLERGIDAAVRGAQRVLASADGLDDSCNYGGGSGGASGLQGSAFGSG